MTTKVLTSKSDILKFDLEILFDCNKWGVFEMGDGECFNSELKGNKSDFYVICKTEGDNFLTTFIPNPKYKPDTSDWDCQEIIDSFKYAETILVTKQGIKENMSNVSGFEIKAPHGHVAPIDNFDFFYCGMHSGVTVEKTLVENHSMYNELIELIELT